MLRKLFKYEFHSTGRMLLPIYILALIYALICKGSLILAEHFKIFNFLGGLMSAIFVLMMFGVFIFTFIVMIQRFYKNLICDEGYLMFTLPINNKYHILTKLITSMVWIVLSALIAVVCILIVISYPRMLSDFSREFSIFFSEMLKMMNISWGFVIVEFIITFIIGVASSILFVYVSIAIGQLLTGHKAIGSIITYIVLNTALQIIMTIALIIISTVFPDLWVAMSNSQPSFMANIILIITIVVSTLFSVGCFLTINHIFNKKLNLE